MNSHGHQQLESASLPLAPPMPIHFYLGKYRFVLKPLGKMHLPPYKGATLRGGFGYAFKDLVCIKPDLQCETCLIQERCPYFQIFETPVPKGATMMRKYTRAPHPFVLTPPLDERTEFSEKDELRFELVLIGHAIEHLPYFIYTFEELGRRGVGRRRGKFQLARVESSTPDSFASSCLSGKNSAALTAIYDGATKILRNHSSTLSFSDIHHASSLSLRSIKSPRLTLHFLTPVRISTNGKLDHKLSFTNLMKALLRRIQLLQHFYCLERETSGHSFVKKNKTLAEQDSGAGGESLTLSEVHRLLKLSESVETEKSRLKFNDLMRYSTRQKHTTSISGFTGEITFEFPDMNHFFDFAPYLELGVLIHVGNGTSFGLGKYVTELKGRNYSAA